MQLGLLQQQKEGHKAEVAVLARQASEAALKLKVSFVGPAVEHCQL